LLSECFDKIDEFILLAQIKRLIWVNEPNWTELSYFINCLWFEPNIIYLLEMRNTYDNKHPFSKSQPGDLQESKDLDSYSVQGKMSYQKQPPNTNVSNNEKMTKNIL